MTIIQSQILIFPAVLHFTTTVLHYFNNCLTIFQNIAFKYDLHYHSSARFSSFHSTSAGRSARFPILHDPIPFQSTLRKFRLPRMDQGIDASSNLAGEGLILKHSGPNLSSSTQLNGKAPFSSITTTQNFQSRKRAPILSIRPSNENIQALQIAKFSNPSISSLNQDHDGRKPKKTSKISNRCRFESCRGAQSFETLGTQGSVRHVA